MLDAYIYEGLRTPFGRHGGSLAKVRPDDLLAEVMKSVMAKSKFKIEQVEDIVVGCANQSGEDSGCVARHAGLSAGFPIEIPGTVLQRNCASGLGALAHAAHSITAGEGDVFIVAGVESMSRSPIVMSRAETAFDRGIKFFDSTIGPRFSNPKLTKQFGDPQMPQTADNLARATAMSPRDSQDPAVTNYIIGVEMTEKELLAAFERNGLKKIEPAKGEKFDPHLHQAVMEQPSKIGRASCRERVSSPV